MTLQRSALTFVLLLLIGAQSAVRLSAITGAAPIPSLDLAPDGRFEWLVRLEADGQTCTGSLIAADWVLTAAHCADARRAIIGDSTVGVGIAEVHLHPQFQLGENQFDVALLRLEVPSSVRPVRRASATLGIEAGQELTLAGWGRTSLSGPSAVQPSSAAAFVEFLDNTMIQTGGPAVACAGDSGGPLLSEGILVGVIVAGDAQCNLFSLSVRFSNIRAWVTSVAGTDSANLPPVVLSGELTVMAGQLFEIPIEFSDPETTIGLEAITSFNPGGLQIISCGALVPTTCRVVAPAGSSRDLLLTYTVSDGELSTRARWTIHVIGVNQPPVAEDSGFFALPGVARAVTLTAFDDGAALLFEIVAPPSHGVLSNCATGTCSYTAHAGYAGIDRFTWRVGDGELVSNVATMHIEVQPAQAPSVVDGAGYAVNDTPTDFIMRAQDPNGDEITFEVVTQPRHGLFTNCSESACTYVADSGFLGTDSFTWRASDGVLSSALATFTIEVLPHHPPFANDDNVHGKVNTVRHFELVAGDPDGNPVTLTLLTMPQHGTLTCAALACEYRPRLDFAGVDSFTWRVSDGDLSSRIATATLHTHASSWRVTPLDLAGDAHALASSIVGPSGVVSNAVLAGAPAAAGAFAGAADAIGLAGGVILSTGRVADALGPNISAFTSTEHNLAGDADLSAPSADAVSLSFDMVPTGSTFTVRYVFGSEEYPFGVGFVDEAAAIIVNGTNCALVGGQRVGVSSINQGNEELGLPASNPGLFIANYVTGAVDTEMNGLTVVLSCTAAVVPGQRNHIKIVLADGFDGQGDSVLFIEGTAAVNTPPTMAPLADITRSAVNANGATVTFNASGNDAEDGALPAECLLASGSEFPIGETIVSCTVTDQGGATASGTFTVTITEPVTPGAISGDGHVRDGATRYQFSFDARENDRGERAKVSLRITPESPKGKGKDRDDRFESRTVTFIAFSDDPNVRHRPRRPQIDTVLFSGIGEWNGKGGFRYEVSAQDEAEAGRRHRESIRVTVWNAAGQVVANFEGEVGGGSIRSKRLKH